MQLKRTNNGFTLLEVIIALAIAVVIYMVFFRFVNLFFQTRGNHEANQDIIRVSDQILTRFSQMGQGADSVVVNANGNQISVKGKPCALMVFDPVLKQVRYGENISPSCTPPSTTSALLNDPPTEVTSFTLVPISTASAVKSVRLSFNVFSRRPFATKSAQFTSAITLWK